MNKKHYEKDSFKFYCNQKVRVIKGYFKGQVSKIYGYSVPYWFEKPFIGKEIRYSLHITDYGKISFLEDSLESYEDIK